VEEEIYKKHEVYCDYIEEEPSTQPTKWKKKSTKWEEEPSQKGGKKKSMKWIPPPGVDEYYRRSLATT